MMGAVKKGARCALFFVLAVGCGSDEDEAAAETTDAPPPEVAPPPPPVEEDVIGNGVAKEQRVFVRVEPRDDARAVGILVWGAHFEISQRQDVGDRTWYRMRGVGWVTGDEVQARFDGEEASLAFEPVQPRLDNPMPYRVARVTAESVPVYRRPPRQNEDPERVKLRELREGYFFTVDKWVNIYGRPMYRTTRYWFVPRDGTVSVSQPDFEGVEVDDDTELPFLWVTDPTARLCEAPGEAGDAAGRGCAPVERHTRLPFHERREGGGSWYRTRDNKWIVALQVSHVSRVARRPDGVGPNERWIHVSLRNQFAALYEGDHMRFVTLVSSGDDEHPTPSGTYRVESKFVSATMDDEDNMSGPYFIQDVPWVIYFQGGYALHAAFWHDRFGLRTSHGCVNLSPRDARRFFEFVQTPVLPAGLHGAFTPPNTRGTVVHITE
jgi:hypothetical protein